MLKLYQLETKVKQKLVGGQKYSILFLRTKKNSLYFYGLTTYLIFFIIIFIKLRLKNLQNVPYFLLF
jgi:hypothetical protein